MHDAMMVEHTGIAATAIITDRFMPTAQAMAQMSGLSGFPFAVIPHPISHNNEVELRAKAASAVQQCVAILTQP
jgi:peptidase E